MTIIKLSYLQQAIELVNNDGAVSKKKLVETTRSVAFRTIPIIAIKEKEQTQVNKIPATNIEEARLVIEETFTKKAAAVSHEQRPIINDQPAFSQSQIEQSEIPVTIGTENNKPKTGLASLNKIRQKLTEQNKNAGLDIKEITAETLKTAWQLFIDKLVARKNPAAVTNFKNAALSIIDNNTIEIITKGEIHKAFIENERADLILHLQNYFCNRVLVYRIVVLEDATEAVATDAPLTRKQQYQKIIEEYPLVKELKERLKLELD